MSKHIETPAVEAHTPEPWLVWGDAQGFARVGPSPNYTVAACMHTPGVDSYAANARRIVACVNACEGMSTESLESIAGRIASKSVLQMHANYVSNKAKVADLEQQRDKLLAALENILAITNDSRGVAGYHLNGDIAEWDSFQEIAEAEAVIAEAKGESK